MARVKRSNTGRPANLRLAATMRPAGILRPFTAGPNAIPLGNMVSKYTLKALNDEGYVNSNVKPQTLEEAQGLGAEIRQADKQLGHLEQGEPSHIHPCLQRSQWEEIDDDEDWEAVLPSVELASRLLDDPGIACFFAGIANNIGKLDDPIHAKAHNMQFRQWDYDNRATQSIEAKKEALFAMMAFRDSIVLRFGDTRGSHARTGWTALEKKCVVLINQDYLSILREDPGYGAQRWSEPWAPGTDEGSARLRTRFLLAVTLVHEFAHCAYKIRFKGKSGTGEPYLRDRPINELGYELENMIFSGWIEPSGENPHASSPYGLVIERYPGQMQLEDIKRKLIPRGTPRDWGVFWTTEYPIHMDFCNKMFTKVFWQDEVLRYGLSRCRPERRKGVRWRYGDPVKIDTEEAAMSPKTLALHRLRKARRQNAMKRAVKADDVDTSDEEDEGKDGFVFRGSHKEAIRRQAEEVEEDGDIEMLDA